MGFFRDYFVGKVIGPREPIYSFTLNVKENPTSVDCRVVKEPVLFHGRRRTRLAVYDASLPQSYQSEDTQLARVTGEWIHTDNGIVFREIKTENITIAWRKNHIKGLVRGAIKAAVCADESPIFEWQSSDDLSTTGGYPLYLDLGLDPDMESRWKGFIWSRCYLRRRTPRSQNQ